MKHQIIVSVTEQGNKKNTVLKGQKLTLPGKLMKLLFGGGQKVLLLVPGDSVESVAIKEVVADVRT